MKQFHSFRLDIANQCLWHGDTRLYLAPKSFDVLRYLVQHAGRLVTPDELLDALWPGTHVNPEVLRKYLLIIRKILGDRPDKPVFIETVPRRGYQFIAPVIEDIPAKQLNLPAQAARNIVGRGPALVELDECLTRALRGQRQIVLVIGEPGIGKTTLVDEFQRLASARLPSLRVARGQCVEGYGGKEAYYSVLEAVGGLCQSSDGEYVVATLAAQAPTWLVQFPGLVKYEHRQMLQREILGATRERMLREISEALETITTESPLLLVLEDLHWSDQATVDLISVLARRRQAAKLMVVGTYRPVDLILKDHPLKAVKQNLQMHHLCREIELPPLQEGEVAEYLMVESGGAALPEDLPALIYRHSEGNPLFMVAALEHMTQRHLLSRESRQWKFSVPSRQIDLEVPQSLRQMLEAEIDQLGSEEKRVLEVASLESVGGSRFGALPRAAAIEMEPDEFEDVCERLSRRHGIVRPAGFAELPDGKATAVYEFVHALYRETCYRRIAPRRRAQLHKQIGEWAEAHVASDAVAAVLAGHFEEAGEWPRAIKYLILAANMAARRFEPQQTSELLEKALKLVKRLPEADRSVSEAETLEKLAAIYTVLGDDERAIACYEALAARAARDGRIDAEVRALIDMAWPLSWSSCERSLEIVDRALQLSSRQVNALQRARARASCLTQRIWSAGWDLQDVEEFRHAFTEILKTDDRSNLAPYLVDSGFINLISSRYREAHLNLIESRAIKLETVGENLSLNNTYLAGQCLVPMSLLLLGEWGEALREIRDGIALLDKNAEHGWGQAVQLYRGWVHLYAMDYDGVLAICNSTLPQASEAEERSGQSLAYRMSLILAGSAETALGSQDVALGHLMMAANMERPGVMFSWFWHVLLESALSELWLAKGDLTEARSHAEKYLRTATATAEHTWQALAWEMNARVAIAAEDWTRGLEYIEGALSAIEGFEVPLAAWRVHATAFRLYQNAGFLELAERHLASSRSTIRRLADSLASEVSLRETFLSAPVIRKILGNS